MKKEKKTLWTKDFSCITAATILSAVGGEAMNLPISLLVFDETGSTILSALVLICGVLPDVLFSVLVAPLIDKGNRKKWIVGLDLLTVAVYFAMGVWISNHAFYYGIYLPYPLMVINRFICGALGTSSATIRETAVQSYLPDQMRARVNAVFNMVFAVGSVAFQLAAGVMGQLMPYRVAIVLLSVFTLVCMLFLVVRPAKENRPVYEAIRS